MGSEAVQFADARQKNEVENTVCAGIAELDALQQNGSVARFNLAIWFYPPEIEAGSDGAFVERLTSLADNLILIPGAGADVAKRRPGLVLRLARSRLLPDLRLRGGRNRGRRGLVESEKRNRVDERASPRGRERLRPGQCADARSAPHPPHPDVGTGSGRSPHRPARGKGPQAQKSTARPEAAQGGKAGLAQITGAQGRPSAAGALSLAAKTDPRSPQALWSPGPSEKPGPLA